jgi:hypothetical protein
MYNNYTTSYTTYHLHTTSRELDVPKIAKLTWSHVRDIRSGGDDAVDSTSAWLFWGHPILSMLYVSVTWSQPRHHLHYVYRVRMLRIYGV